jgi:hypothetical protein
MGRYWVQEKLLFGNWRRDTGGYVETLQRNVSTQRTHGSKIKRDLLDYYRNLLDYYRNLLDYYRDLDVAVQRLYARAPHNGYFFLKPIHLIFRTPKMASLIIFSDILDCPFSRSLKTMGTSVTLKPNL